MTDAPPLGIKKELQSLDSNDFEYFVADLWERRGFKTKVTSATNDGGVDVVATKNEPYPQKEVLQAKRYSASNSVGSRELREYYAVLDQENADTVVVVTTGNFTRDAEEKSKKLNVKTVDIDGLLRMISDNEAWDLVDQYLGTEISEAGKSPEVGGRNQSKTAQDDEELDLPTALVYLAQGGVALAVIGFILYFVIQIFMVTSF